MTVERPDRRAGVVDALGATSPRQQASTSQVLILEPLGER